MPFCVANEIKICYETLGDPAGEPVLLIAGLGVQLLGWDDHILDPLIHAGFRLIVFDNRDIGLSTHFDDGLADPKLALEALLAHQDPGLAYTLADMATDSARLLESLGIEAAHVVGVSMGGMIAQRMAIDHPRRVASLTSVMASTGASDVGQPTEAALEALVSAPKDDSRESYLDHVVAVGEVWASPGYFDAAALRMNASAEWDRVGGAQNPNMARHFCALVSARARDDALGNVKNPSMVLHGSVDPLIDVSGGVRTSGCLPDSRLEIIDGMAHDMVPAFADRLTGSMISNFRRAEGSAGYVSG